VVVVVVVVVVARDWLDTLTAGEQVPRQDDHPPVEPAGADDH
jgi:hypothetical protein